MIVFFTNAGESARHARQNAALQDGQEDAATGRQDAVSTVEQEDAETDRQDAVWDVEPEDAETHRQDAAERNGLDAFLNTVGEEVEKMEETKEVAKDVRSGERRTLTRPYVANPRSIRLSKELRSYVLTKWGTELLLCEESFKEDS